MESQKTENQTQVVWFLHTTIYVSVCHKPWLNAQAILFFKVYNLWPKPSGKKCLLMLLVALGHIQTLRKKKRKEKLTTAAG